MRRKHWLSAIFPAIAFCFSACTVGSDDLPNSNDGPTGKATAALELFPTPPTIDYPAPGGDSVALTTTTIDSFLNYVVRASATQQADIVDKVYAARCTPTGTCPILDALVARLNDTTKTDVTLTYACLTVIGELGDARAITPLYDFATQPIPPPPEQEYEDHGEITSAAIAEMLEARAAEALGFIATTDALNAVLTLATTHSSFAVRAAAADAYVYNSPNEASARTTLDTALSGTNKKLAWRFDKSPTMTELEFATKHGDYDSRYPFTPPPPIVNANDPPITPSVPEPVADPSPPFKCPPNTVCRLQ